MQIEVRDVNHMEHSSTSDLLKECVGLITPLAELTVLNLSKPTRVFSRNSVRHAYTDGIQLENAKLILLTKSICSFYTFSFALKYRI